MTVPQQGAHLPALTVLIWQVCEQVQPAGQSALESHSVPLAQGPV
jgi:hypothetical protein